MDWIREHQVLIAGIVAAALVLVALTFLVVRGLALWRGTKREIERTTREIATISRVAAETGARVENLSGRQEELSAAIEILSGRIGVLKVILGHATAALAIFRGPLRYLGR